MKTLFRLLLLCLILGAIIILDDVLFETDVTDTTDITTTVTSLPSTATIATTSSTPSKQIWAFYLSFWIGAESWQWQADVLTDYPSIGTYDSRNFNIASIHIQQAQETGLDAFVMSWFGVQDQNTTTATINNMMQVAETENFQIGVVLDAFNPQFLSNQSTLDATLAHLNEALIPSPAYLTHEGRPVVMFAFQENSGLSSQDWLALRDKFDPDRQQLWIAEGLNGCCIHNGAMDAMYAFNMAWGNGTQSAYETQSSRAIAVGADFFMPTIHPGWDESLIAERDNRGNPTSPRPRNDGDFLRTSFLGASATGTDIILIGTWNEFMENSHIEPSRLYGTQALDTLRPLIVDWKQTP